MRKFVSFSTFAAKPSFSSDYQKGMEEGHLPYVLESGFFEPGYEKDVDTTTESGSELVTYTLTLKDGEDGWNDYQDIRQSRKDDFSARFGGAMASGDLEFRSGSAEWRDKE